MTALKEYARLESGGLWRADPEGQRRDVVVSFGDATLVIADGAGRPLTHWSLAAVARLNPGERPALFAPDAEADETLELDDGLMIDAIEKVRKTVARARPRPGKLRHLTTVAVIAALVGGAVFWLPDALHRQALDVVPASKRAEIGATVLGYLQRNAGPTCRGDLGQRALTRMQKRLLPDGGTLVVMPLGQSAAIGLPGHLIVMDRTLVETIDDPLVTAGYVLAADSRSHAVDPLSPILSHGGIEAVVTLLTTGDLPADVLEDYAMTLVDTPQTDLPETALLDAFAMAQVPSAPFGRERVARGLPVMELVTDDPVDPDTARPVLRDAEWVSLQGICDI